MVAVSRLFQEYQRINSGRWRPSAVALRLGSVAVRLERLIYAHGYTLPEAISRLQHSEPDLPEERELVRLASLLPDRQPLRQPLRPTLLPLNTEHLSGRTSADDALISKEDRDEQARVVEALQRALTLLDPEDSVILQMRLLRGFSIPDIARVLGVEPKPLYRRIERLISALRPELERAGITSRDVAGLIEAEL
ncbi:DNA-directed RNA polymerase specialized sigma subunit [Longimicrobium terrae]|nr:DNA-directed RNA polymerase specialized sigma subunit [Longimicrobium terrae]